MAANEYDRVSLFNQELTKAIILLPLPPPPLERKFNFVAINKFAWESHLQSFLLSRFIKAN